MTGTLVPALDDLDDHTPGTCTSRGAERPVWLTRGRWPLFAWVHEPGTRPAGAVVLCPPLLGEHLTAHSLQRVVARSLAGRGLLAVRFDYEGTGDSGGPQGGPSRVVTWLEGVDQAMALARSRCDGPLTLVGVRSGALVAAQAAVRTRAVDALVLWDPWPNGRAFLRRQRALQSLRLHGTSVSTDTEVPGFTVDRATVEAIEGLRLPASLPVRRALLVSRPKSEPAAPVLTPPGAGAGGTGSPPAQEIADLLVAAEGEQEACFEIEPLRRQVPAATADAVVDWIAGAVGSLVRDRGDSDRGEPRAPAGKDRAGLRAGSDPIAGSPRSARWATGEVTIAPAVPGEVTVTERVCMMGPHRLFAIETAPGAPPPAPATGRSTAQPTVAATVQPTVLFLSSGTDSHIGPARLWVTLARRLAGSGLRCLRVDLSGLGDSPARPGRPEGVIRALEAFDDVAEVVAAAGNPRTIVLAGLCSGAYQALESALELRPLGVVAVNPLLRFTPPEVEGGGPVSPRRRLCQPRPAWIAGARRALPQPVGRAMASARRVVGRARATRQRRATWVRELRAAGVDVYCVCGEDEAGQLHEAGFTSSVDGRTHLDVLPGLDHGLTVASQRDAVLDRVTRALQAMAGARSGTALDGRAPHGPDSVPVGGARP